MNSRPRTERLLPTKKESVGWWEHPLFCYINWSVSLDNDLSKGTRRRPYVVDERLSQENVKCSPKLRDRNIVAGNWTL